MSGYIESTPSYGVFDRQVLTGDGSTTAFNLDYIIHTNIIIGGVRWCLARTRIFLFTSMSSDRVTDYNV